MNNPSPKQCDNQGSFGIKNFLARAGLGDTHSKNNIPLPDGAFALSRPQHRVVLWGVGSVLTIK